MAVVPHPLHLLPAAQPTTESAQAEPSQPAPSQYADVQAVRSFYDWCASHSLTLHAPEFEPLTEQPCVREK